MKRNIIIRVILLLLILGLVFGGITLRNSWSQKKEVTDQATLQLQQLTEQAELLSRKLAGLTMDQAQAQTAQAETLREEAAALTAEMEELQKEIDSLTLHLEENKEALASVQEELTYLQGVYDALEDGLQNVEKYIAAD